ncbi:hypothetical protein L0U85_03870 [Glycomyces sp. L485]|uniref:hypothetical protein n=1 Tax=Glycomyces sp. L485 TaxID=2909235 RepID=UPI001F4B16D4|nr:hypothetical protein [Glycomyces sp. L485]MCH7230000.1 hypothetical protein [Glycomyces sp. L485]
MTDTEHTGIIVPLADQRAQQFCGATCRELRERLPLLDSYLPDEINEAAAALNDRDNVAATILDGYRAAIESAGVRSRKRVRRQLESAEHALAIGEPLSESEVERLGRPVQVAITERNEALRALDERLRLAHLTLTDQS